MCGATGETAADLGGHVKLSTREGSGSGDHVIRAAIARSLRLKEREYTFGGISRPCRDGPSFGFGQRLRRTHSGILADSSALTGFELAASMRQSPTTSSEYAELASLSRLFVACWSPQLGKSGSGGLCLLGPRLRTG